MLQEILKELHQFLLSSAGMWTLTGLVSSVVLAIVYHRKRQIPGLTVENIEDDTWFINRDDNHRLAIVVSLHLTNRSGMPIRLRKCKLSGYSPKEPPSELFLEGHDKTVPLEYPKHERFSGSEYIVNPYTEQRFWVFYQSKLVTMTNMIRTPIIIKDANRKRKSIQLVIPRNNQQILLYREAAMRW